MRTRSSSNLPGESSPNPTSSNPKHRNRRRSKQPFILEESPIDTMADQRTMEKLLRAPTEGYAEAIVVPSILAENFELKHGLINMMTLDQFFELEKDNPHDHIRWFNKITSSIKYKAKLTHAANQQTSVVTTVMTAILKQFQATPPPAFVKAIEEICVTCCGAHSYYQCLTADGTTFLEFQDNIQGYVSAAAVNYNQSLFWLSSSGCELKAITTRSGLVLDGPFVPMHPPYINPKEDERVEETLMDPKIGEEMILHDSDERLTLNMRHDTSSYSNQPQKESINMINIYDDSCEDYLEDLFATNHQSGNPTFSSHLDLTSLEVKDDIFDPVGDIVLIEKLLNLDSTMNSLLSHFHQEMMIFRMESILKDLIDECKLADPNDNLVDTIPEMFTDEHTLDYSSPLLYDDYDDDLDEFEFDNDNAYNDPFDSKEEKIKESKLLIDELDLPRSSDFLPSLKYDSFLFEDFSEVDALPSTDNEDKVLNPGILIHENLYEVIVQVAPDKNEKKISTSHASLILEDFDPPLYELPFYKEVLRSKTLLSFSSENEEKVFKPRILTSKEVHTSLLPELYHRGPKAFKALKFLKA
nr:reverse transcriptase domain-containing protein [Tanacetum cinerariifolium]